MKNLLKIWALCVILITVVCISMAFGMSAAEQTQIVNVSALPDPVAAPQPVWQWITTNWAVIALVASEVAAFLPTKINGILQGILKIGGFIFGGKKNK